MRVLHVRPILQRGGATEYVVRLAEGLSARGHSQFVATGGGDWVERTRRYATVDASFNLAPRIGKLPNLPALLASGVRLAALVRRERIDLINTHHRFAALAGRVAATATGVPQVTTLHEVPRGSPRLTVLGLGQGVVTLSGMMRDLMLTRYRLNPARVRTIPMGVATVPPLSEARRAALRAELGLDADAPVVGCIGRLVPRKGQIYLLRAMPEVLAAHPRTQLLLIGDGQDRAALTQAAVELGVAQAVRFAGARDDAQALVELCSFMALPSQEEEFGIVLIEALAQGRPVVAAAVGGVPEIIRPEETGLLVPPRDPVALAAAMVRLLNEPELAQAMGASGLREVERRFSQRAFLDATEQLYRALLRPAGVGAAAEGRR